MMRFGNYNSPVLLNALGDVLLNETYSEPGAKRLSAMAYMASDLYNAGSVSLKTKENIQLFLSMQESDKNTYEELLKEVKKGILIGKSRYAEIEKKERNWVVENKDLDVEFAQDFYAKTDSKNKNDVAQNNQNKITKNEDKRFNKLIIGLIITLVIVGIIVILKLRKKHF